MYDTCMAAPHVQTRTKRRLCCPDQPDPGPDPDPSPTFLGGSRSALEVGRGSTAVLSLRANMKNPASMYVQ